GAPVALKLLHRGVLSEQEATRFVREANLLAGLCHPGIARYVGHGVLQNGQAYLAMEWVEGETLESRLSHGGLTLNGSRRCLRSAAVALSEVHQQGIVHRDIKPANLFLRDGDLDRVVLLDFGIARPGGPAQAVTQTGMQVGTPDYMAPEQARGQRQLTP